MVIRFFAGERSQRVALALRCLGDTGMFFERSGAIVKLQTDSRTGDASFKDLNVAEMMRALDEVSAWQRYDKRVKDWVAIDPPENFCSHLLKAGATEGLQALFGVARQPYLRPDGSLCAKAGYDPVSRLFGVFEPNDFNVAEEPTREDAVRALERLDSLIAEFPFASAEDRSAVLAAMLTATVRVSLPLAPMFHVRAHEAGTGKSYLCAVISAFATARAGAPLAFPGSNDECDKLLLAELMRGPDVIEFDNLTTDIKPYRRLCTMLTSESVSGRVLGKSRVVAATTRVLTLSSGNNVGPVADMARRCVTINLDAKEEIPASRTFKTSDLVGELRLHRASYVSAALTVVRAWICAGQPKTACKPLASYDSWSDWCRQPLLWLERADPAASVFESMATDPERESLGLLLAAWLAKFGDGVVMARDLIQFGGKLDPDAQEMQEVLLEIAGDRERVSPRRLGWWLKKHVGQIAGGVRIQKAPRTRNAEAYRVVAV